MNLRYKFQILEKIPQHLLIDHFPTVDLSSVGSNWNRRYRNFSKKIVYNLLRATISSSMLAFYAPTSLY